MLRALCLFVLAAFLRKTGFHNMACVILWIFVQSGCLFAGSLILEHDLQKAALEVGSDLNVKG